MENEVVITGQGAQENLPQVDVGPANDLLANNFRRKASKQSGKSIDQMILSDNIKRMIESPSFRSDNGIYDTDGISMRRNISPDAIMPEMVGKLDGEIERLEAETSDTITIVRDSIQQFGMSLMTMGDKGLISLGGVASKLTGQEMWTEMRDRAYESLKRANYEMSMVATRQADTETLTSQITQGAGSMFEMMALQMMTGGIAPIVQMGLDVFGQGTYNNMQKYAQENNGSIEGYEGNWTDIAIDLGNAVAQATIERYLGLGNSRFLKGTGGAFLREALEGFAQESSQEFLSDFGEFIKGNEGAQVFAQNWQNYLVAGAIGGILQGGLGAVTYKGARLKADSTVKNMYMDVVGKANPNIDKDILARDGQAFAKDFNNRVERDVAADIYQELLDRVDTNNDRGRLRTQIYDELVKAQSSAKGISPSEMNEDDLASLQALATDIGRRSIYEANIKGISIQDTLIARIYADGNILKIKDLKSGELGYATRRGIDIEADREALGIKIGEGRESAVRIDTAEDALKDIQMYLDSANAQPMTREQRISKKTKSISESIRKQESLNQKSFATWIRNNGGITEGAMKDLGLDPTAMNQDLKGFQRLIRKNGKIKRGDTVIEQLRSMGYSNIDYDNVTEFLDRNWETLKPVDSVSNSLYEMTGSEAAQQEEYEALNPKQKEYASLTSSLDMEYFDSLTPEQQDAEIQRLTEEQIPPFQEGLINKQPRGKFDSKYFEIILNKNSDISTMVHEFAHLWMADYFKVYRQGTANKGFMNWWGKVESDLGIKPSDIFISRDATEKFAKGFEKFILDGGKGASETMKPAYEKLSKKMADIYDNIASEYFADVQELSKPIQDFFALNESFADSLLGTETEKINRKKERDEAFGIVNEQIKIDGNQSKQADSLNDTIERLAPVEINPETGEPMKSPYTKEGKRERQHLKNIREMASAKGIYMDVVAEADMFASKIAAEDAYNLVRMDYERAKEAAMGRLPIAGVPNETMFIAVRNYALANNDVATLYMLKDSKVVNELSQAGRTLSNVRNFTGQGEFNVLKSLNEINDVYNKQMTDSNRIEVEQQMKRLNEILIKSDIDTESAWNNLLKDMECKI